MHRKSAYFWEHRFCVDFERVWGWLSETKILDFRTSGDVFSIQIDVKLKLGKKAKKRQGVWTRLEAPRNLTPSQGTLPVGVLATFP